LKRSVFSLIAAIAVLALGTIAVQASVNVSGHYSVQLTTSQGLSTGAVTLNQVGTTVVGHGTAGLNTWNGTMVSDTKMNGKWEGPKGAGWITVYFSADGKSFQGTWGFNGKKSSGSMIGKRVPASAMGH
jgi:hypothetical protein